MNSRLRSYGITAAAIAVSSMAPMHIAAQGANFAGQSNSPSRSAVDAAIKEAAAKPTPRAADGHPDLNGSWSPPQLPISAHRDSNGNFYIDAPVDKGGTAPKLDATIAEQLQHVVDPNPPPYKPELLAKVKELASDKIHNDPQFHCKPAGVPRAGAPRQIVQTPKLTVLLYENKMARLGVFALYLPMAGRIAPTWIPRISATPSVAGREIPW